MYKTLVLLIIIFYAVAITPIHAQLVSGDVVLEIFPPNPAPGQEVKARISSYATDLNKAYISWTINGSKLSGGIGKTVYNLDTTNYDGSIEILANIETLSGESLSKKISFTPIAVDMLFEGVDSYVPPFYRGRSLTTAEGTYKVVAMPNIGGNKDAMNPKNFSYAWSKDNKGQIGASGWGKNYFIFSKSFLDAVNKITVDITNLRNENVASGAISLGTSSPKIAFYQENSVLGIDMTETIENGFNVNKDGIIMTAIPYFISVKDRDINNLNFEWKISGNTVSTQNPKNKLSVKPSSGKSGSANIDVFISNYDKIALPVISKKILLNF